MKHPNVLEFLASLIIEAQEGQSEWRGEGGYFPAIYMLLELAAGGDLFDKICMSLPFSLLVLAWTILLQHPMSV